jgi:hypothetical protein
MHEKRRIVMRASRNSVVAVAVAFIAQGLTGCNQIRDLVAPEDSATSVYASVAGPFHAGASLDLDTGDKYREPVDVFWHDACAGAYCQGPLANHLVPAQRDGVPVEAGYAKTIDFESLTLDEVRAFPKSPDFAIDMADVTVGTVLLFRTNQGRYGKLRVDGRETWTLTYTLVTWN